MRTANYKQVLGADDGVSHVGTAQLGLQPQLPPQQGPAPPPDWYAAEPPVGAGIPALTRLMSGMLAELSHLGHTAAALRSTMGRNTSKVAAQSLQRYS